MEKCEQLPPVLSSVFGEKQELGDNTEKNAAAAFNTMHHAVYTKYSQVFSCQLVPMHPSLSIKATYVRMYQIFINQSCHERVIYSAAEQADPD